VITACLKSGKEERIESDGDALAGGGLVVDCDHWVSAGRGGTRVRVRSSALVVSLGRDGIEQGVSRLAEAP